MAKRTSLNSRRNGRKKTISGRPPLVCLLLGMFDLMGPGKRYLFFPALVSGRNGDLSPGSPCGCASNIFLERAGPLFFCFRSRSVRCAPPLVANRRYFGFFRGFYIEVTLKICMNSRNLTRYDFLFADYRDDPSRISQRKFYRGVF